MYNFGSQTSTISQVIKSYYNEKGQIYWVDSSFPPKSIFPKKTISFEVKLKTQDLEIIDCKNILINVNGTNNEVLIEKYQSSDYAPSHKALMLKNGRRIRLNLNNFIGNPTPY